MAYSSILPKVGICVDCSANGDDTEKEIVAGRCKHGEYHYQKFKAKQQNQRNNLKLSVRKLGRGQDKTEVERVVANAGISNLIQDLDAVISRYVRIKEADKNGNCECFTCGKFIHFSMAHCSHFISRQHLGTRFLLDNLRVCCVNCNVNLNGNLVVYAEKLEKEKIGTVEYLQDVARAVCKPTQTELKELLIDMKAKLKLVETKLKNKVI